MTERRQERSSEESEETAITFLSMGPKTSTSPAGVGGRESGTGRVIAALKTAADRADQLERTRVSRDRSVLSGGGLLAHEAPCRDVDQAHGARQETGQECPDTHRSHRHVPGLGQTAADTTEDAVLAGAARQRAAEAGELAGAPGGGAGIALGSVGLTELTGVLLLCHVHKSGREGSLPAIGEPPEKSRMFLGAHPWALDRDRRAA